MAEKLLQLPLICISILLKLSKTCGKVAQLLQVLYTIVLIPGATVAQRTISACPSVHVAGLFIYKQGLAPAGQCFKHQLPRLVVTGCCAGRLLLLEGCQLLVKAQDLLL